MRLEDSAAPKRIVSAFPLAQESADKLRFWIARTLQRCDHYRRMSKSFSRESVAGQGNAEEWSTDLDLHSE